MANSVTRDYEARSTTAPPAEGASAYSVLVCRAEHSMWRLTLASGRR